MEPGEPQSQLARAIRGLTIAVGALGVVILLVFAAYVVTAIQQQKFYEGMTRRGREISSSSSRRDREVTSSSGQSEGMSDFNKLPPEKKIERASAILLTKFEKKDGHYREVVTEILKRRPGSGPSYSVGDEFGVSGLSSPQFPDDVIVSMDGQVVFLAGSPSEMSLTTSYSKGKVDGLGNMPLSKLRELARNAK